MVKTPNHSSLKERTPLKVTAKSCKTKSQVKGVLPAPLFKTQSMNAPRLPNLQDQVSLQVDRFIPTRSAIDLDLAGYKLLKENENASPTASTPSRVGIPL